MLVEYIKYKQEDFAIVVRAGYKNESVHFFTSDENEFQMGMFTRESDHVVRPHKHVCDPFKIRSVQEYIVVKNGKLRVEFFTENGEKYAETILGAGDSVLTMVGGHGITFLEKSTILELKQGPYGENKKVYF